MRPTYFRFLPALCRVAGLLPVPTRFSIVTGELIAFLSFVRRKALMHLCLLVGTPTATLAAAPNADSAGHETKRPNIIFILTDDQRFDTLGCTGSPIVRTPHIDRLARQGVLFRNASVTSAICTPSRVSIMLGQYERRHGVNFNSGTAVSEAAWKCSYPVILRKHGYFTGYIGKNHSPVGPDGYRSQIMDASFDYWYASHKHLGFYPKEKPAFMAATPGYDDMMFRNATADTQVEIISEGLFNALEPNEGFYEHAVRFLNRRKPGQPFCLSVCFNLPHDASTSTMELRDSDPDLYRTAYRDQRDAILAGLPGTYVAKAAIKTPKVPAEVFHTECRQHGYDYVDKPGTLVERLIRRYQAITGIDRLVGALGERLERLGIADNTVIIFTSDHGIMRGEFGLGGKSINYEPCLRVPLILYDPRIPGDKRGRVLDQLVQSIDIAPTILGMAGIEPAVSMQGESFLPLLEGKDVPWRQHAFAENLWSNRFGNPRIESVRGTDGWKYIRYFKNDVSRIDGTAAGPADGKVTNIEARRYRDHLYASIRGENPVYEELFNLNDDPDEIHNLASIPEYEEILKRLRTICQERVAAARGDSELHVVDLSSECRETSEVPSND